MDFIRRKENFINNELFVYDSFSPEIMDSFAKNSYEDFLPEGLREKAYSWERIKISDGRYAQNLLITAELLKLAEIKSGDFVLNVGAGYGYVSALLASLADAVLATEHEKSLFDGFEKKIIEMKLDNIALFKTAKGKGYEEAAPFDIIFINDVVSDREVEDLIHQLSDNGRIVGIEKNGKLHDAFVISKTEAKRAIFRFI